MKVKILPEKDRKERKNEGTQGGREEGQTEELTAGKNSEYRFYY